MTTAFAATLAVAAGLGLVGQAEPDSPVGRLDDRHHVVTAASADSAAAVVVTSPKLAPSADD